MRSIISKPIKIPLSNHDLFFPSTTATMVISSATLSFTSSIPRPPPSLSSPFSCSKSAFFANNATANFFTNGDLNHFSLLRTSRFRTTTYTPHKGLTCNALFGLGVPELVVIAGVAALVFGPKKLPEVGKSIGKTVKSFQQAAKEFESELKKEPESIEETAVEKPTSAEEEERQDLKVSNQKETV
ncbi:sec-independent protein translocase protein TATA, chloroplastic [Benincasa hispida]|uniref:sec-independent protein translocase protein TATA, chloroplastic n=1 Tax=Benincasa hispida TaxID=102211 RepID=UPI0019018AEC|nr:sec-independent protein translocase protein TATA, chloroplastic [Benincasa hispida]